MLKVALAGAGRGHAMAYLKGALAVEGTEAVGIVDRDLANARAFAEEGKLPGAYDSFAALAEKEKPDCVMISSETDRKLDYVREAVSLGVPILCDKPVGRNSSEAREIASSCKGAGVELMSGYCLRFAAAARALRKVVEEGGLGKLVRARATIFRWALTGWYADASRSGGALMDVGCYLPDLLMYLVGEEPAAVTATGEDDLAVMVIEFPSVLATAEMSCRGPKGARLDLVELEGTSAVAWGNNGTGRWSLWDGEGEVESHEEPHGAGGAYDAMIREFLARVVDKRPQVPDGRGGVIANVVIDAAHRSMAERRRVTLELPAR